MEKNKIKSFFTSLLPLNFLFKILVFSSTNRTRSSFTSSVTSLLLELYTEKYKYERVVLEDVLEYYKLLGVVDVTIGTSNGEFYYVISEPLITQSDIYTVLQSLQRRLKNIEEDDLKIIEAERALSTSEYNYYKIHSGFGPLLPFIVDEKIEDISLSRVNGRVYVVHRDFSWYGWIKSNVIIDPGFVDRLAMAITRRARKHLSVTQPLAEGSIKGSIRVSVVYGDTISAHGTSIVVRKKPSEIWTITRLINEGVIPTELASYLWLILEKRGWVIIAGPVGAGKTTLLQAVLTLIPPNKKVVIIEDVPELTATSDLWDVLAERVEVFQQVSPIDSYTLLKFALRRRPDYVVIGEVRGVEARLLVQASRLGHGVLNTIHADSVESVIQRLTAPPISIPRNLLNNIWVIVLMSIHGNKRRVVKVSEVSSEGSLIDIYDAGKLEYFSVDHVLSRSERLRQHYDSESLSRELVERALYLQRLVSRGVFQQYDLALKITEYYSTRLHSTIRVEGV